MPAYVTATSRSGRTGETTDATLCDPSVTGFPDRRSDVPLKIRFSSDRLLCIDGENRAIIWTRGENGTTYLVDRSTKRLHNRERRAALAKASELLRQLRSCPRPLAAESEEPERVTEGLGLLFDWGTEEHERLRVAPRSPT